jgi:UDP-GlcNAc3NAcA epimerase
LLHTGQHYDPTMSQFFFEELRIPTPAYNLGIGSGLHGLQTGRMLEAIEQVLLSVRPDWVLVYGDTNSTLAGALAAAKLCIPTAHVEAGLRSFDRSMPEEINRTLTDHISALLFSPTKAAVENLRREGIADGRVHLVGDVMYDAAIYYGSQAEAKSQVLQQLNLLPKQYILATLHRAENTDNIEHLRVIIRALSNVTAELPVVMPLHPRTLKVLEREDMFHEVSRHIRLMEPVGYLDMVLLEKNARLIATDSGGIQKEAFFYQVPCVTFREQTEWVELLEMGWNFLVPPTNGEEVLSRLVHALASRPSPAPNPYGDGHSAEKIIDVLLSRGTMDQRRPEAVTVTKALNPVLHVRHPNDR